MDRLPTLPRLLAAQGFVSFQTGKWWQGDFSRGGFTAGMTKGTRHGDDGLTIGRDTMQPMWDFIDGALREHKPFFLWYAPFLPHSPHTPPERLLAKYRDTTPSLHVARYWAMVEWFDETCGQLLAFLDDKKSPTTPSSSMSPTTAGSRTPTARATPRARNKARTTAACARRS
jgi:arylsulfatase A-like enzyme